MSLAALFHRAPPEISVLPSTDGAFSVLARANIPARQSGGHGDRRLSCPGQYGAPSGRPPINTVAFRRFQRSCSSHAGVFVASRRPTNTAPRDDRSQRVRLPRAFGAAAGSHGIPIRQSRSRTTRSPAVSISPRVERTHGADLSD